MQCVKYLIDQCLLIHSLSSFIVCNIFKETVYWQSVYNQLLYTVCPRYDTPRYNPRVGDNRVIDSCRQRVRYTPGQ